jgi:hypothetical protein
MSLLSIFVYIGLFNNDSTRGYPRCKNHGTFSTAAQLEAFLANHNISSGLPTDIMVNDYFTLKVSNSVSYKVWIAGIDTELRKGDGDLTMHHITCIANFGNSKMNSTDTTTGGYNGASVMQTFLSDKATEISTICGSHLLSRKVLLSNAVTNGKSSGWSWYSKQLALLSEQQVYGSIQWGNVYDTGEGYEKLPIFNESTPAQLFGRVDIWLRGVDSTTHFCFAGHGGHPNYGSASGSLAAVALFCLG